MVHVVLWWDFGLPWQTEVNFEGFAEMYYLCFERPFARPNTLTLDGHLPHREADESPELLPPWDGLNLFGGGYVHGEEAQAEYVAKLQDASVDGKTGYVFDSHRIYNVDPCDDNEFSQALEEPEWPLVSHHRRVATIATNERGHYYHWFAENLPRLLLLEEYFAGAQVRLTVPA